MVNFPVCVTLPVLILRYVYTLRYRWHVILLYFLFPSVLLLLGVSLNGVISYEEHEESFESFNRQDLLEASAKVEIVVSPDNEAAWQVMFGVQESLKYGNNPAVVGIKFVNTTEEVNTLLVSLETNFTLGVNFHVINDTYLEYTIRPQAFNVSFVNLDSADYRTNEKFPSPTFRGPRLNRPYIDVPFNWSLSLISLQVAIDKVYTEMHGRSIRADWLLATFPYPAFVELSSQHFVTHRFALLCVQYLLVVGITFMISVFASDVIRDKTNGIRAMLCINGGWQSLVNVGWLLSYCFEAILLSLIEMAILKIPTENGELIQYMSSSVLLIVLIACNCSSLCWVFFIASFSTNSLYCVTFILTIWAILPLCFQTIPPGSFVLQGCLAPLPNAGMVLIFKSFEEFDAAETEVDFNRLSEHPIHHLRMNVVLWIMFATSFFLVLLCVYIDTGTYGPKIWLPPAWKPKRTRQSPDHPEFQQFFDSIDQEPVAIECVDINKYFGKHKVIDNLNLKLLKNQVTVLVGPNGAGKSVLMSMFVGLNTPTKGNLFSGRHTFKSTKFKKLRKIMGYCPQNDILINELTFEQNFVIFTMLKGISYRQAMEYSDTWTASFHIEHCRNRQVKCLSNGDRRKLSLAIAMSGSPLYLFLDHPTSGLDVRSKRKFWSAILQKKGKCTIFMSTHNLDEADILGDRVVILEKGTLLSHISCANLKDKFNIGYKVTCEIDEKNIQKLVGVVRSFHDSMLVIFPTKQSVSFGLPREFRLRQMPNLLKALEDAFGTNFTTSVSYLSVEDILVNFHNNEDQINLDELRVADDIKNTCCGNVMAVFRKKIRCLWSKRLLSTIFIVLPAVGMGIAAYMAKSTFRNTAEFFPNDLKFTMDEYQGSMAILRNNSSGVIKSAVNNSLKSQEVTQDIRSYLDELAKKDLFKYRSHYVLAFDISPATSPVAYFSRNAFHSAPIAYSAMMNALLNGSSIVTHNLPFMKKEELSACKFDNSLVTCYLLLALLGPVLMNMRAYFLWFLHAEKKTTFKKLQLMSGLSPPMYWVSNLIFDMVLFSFSCSYMVIVAVIVDADFFSKFMEVDLFLLVLFLYGVSSTTLAYVWSFSRFPIPVCVSWYFAANFLLALGYTILETIVSLSGNPGERTWWQFLPWLNLMDTLEKILIRTGKNWMCHVCVHSADYDIEECNKMSERPLIDSLRNNLWAFVFQFLVWLSLIVAMDYGLGRKLKPIVTRVCYGKIDSGHPVGEIVREKDRVRQLAINIEDNQPQLTCDSLGKKYSPRITAVRDFTFITDRGQLFGLIGPNGAGKSTIFEMLTGLISPTEGTAMVQGKWELVDCEFKYARNFGYSPQAYGLLPGLTGRAALTLFGRLRGLKDNLKSHVDNWIAALSMTAIADNYCEFYSVGTKRKLNFAIAMIANPSVVFLDEADLSIDPYAKTIVRQILLGSSNQAIVVTSHNMSECELLCTRLAIIVHGEVQRLESLKQLKRSLGKLCVLQVKFIEGASPVELNSFQFKIEHHFAGNIFLQARPVNYLIYHVSLEKFKIHELFAFMLKMKADFATLDTFNITEAPLEEVFMTAISKSRKV